MNRKIQIIIGLVVVVGVSFYGGMKYGAGNTSAQNLSAGARGTGFQRIEGAGGAAGRTGALQNGGFVSGEITSKDEKSITVTLRDPRQMNGATSPSQGGGLASPSQGGSRIVFFSSSTQVMKSTSGSLDDLKAGEQITVTGNMNTDGSVTAQSVQIRPAGGR